MAQVTHVKKAQQRYRTVPVLDENGQPKRTPVIGRNGQQKTSKRGPQFMAVTAADKTQPLPLEVCDFCRKDIEVGTPYKHVSPKSGPYGGQKRSRHEACPTWQPWDLSNSLSARLAQVQYEFSTAIEMISFEDEGALDDVKGALDAAAESAREIASEKEEGADNMEDGFGHETESSNALRETAQSLEGWADEIEGVDLPDFPEAGQGPRWFVINADGSGDVFEDEEFGFASEEAAQERMATLEGEESLYEIEERETDLEEPSEDDVEAWADEVRDAATSVVDSCPV